MSFTIDCPVCGKRNAYEFRYGEVDQGPRPAQDGITAEEWCRYVHLRPNVGGVQKEWWCHRDGCGVWFTIHRDTLSNLQVQVDDSEAQ